MDAPSSGRRSMTLGRFLVRATGNVRNAAIPAVAEQRLLPRGGTAVSGIACIKR